MGSMSQKPRISRIEHSRQYREFVLAHGRTPLQTAADPAERKMAVFATLFRRVDPSSLSPEEAKARAEVILLHNRYTTRRHKRRRIPDLPGSTYAVEVSDFFDAHGRLPDCNEHEEDAAFASLLKLRHYANSPDAAAILHPLADIPGLLDQPTLKTELRLKSVADWYEKNGRAPSKHSEDLAERRLYEWWGDAKRSYSTLSPDAKERADQLIRAYRQQQGGQPRGLGQAAQVARFYAANGHLPRFNVDGEQSDYARLRRLRHYKLNGLISREAIEAVKDVPNVFKNVRKSPDAQLLKLEEWCREHGRIPRFCQPKEDGPVPEEEARLAQWMYRHVHRRHDPVETPHTQDRRQRILELRDRYPMHHEHLHGQKSVLILDFIASKGRLPDLVNEPELYKLCVRLRLRWQKGGSRVAAINDMLEATAALPDHLHSQWDGRLRKLEEFMGEFGRLPRPRSGCGTACEPGEVQLGRWTATADQIDDPIRRQRLAALVSEGLAAA